MRLTTKGRFAVTAMVDLALRQNRGPVTLAAISERQHISLSYLEQLFGKLRRAALVSSVRGPGGGYNLAQPPASISVADIVSAVDEPIDATQCGGKENCHDDKRCMTHDLWATLNEKMQEYLSSVALKKKRSRPRGDEMRLPVYLDYSATTPVDRRVAEKMIPFLTEHFGNAASRSHAFGWKAEEAVEEARAHVAALLNADPKEIVWTSGATEGNNLAIKGAANFYKTKGKHIITQKTEHKAVLDTFRELERQGFEATYLEVDANGLISLDQLKKAIRADTILVSIMMVNNEIGVVQPVWEIADLCRSKGIIFHCDAVQGAGRLEIDVQKFKVDLLTITAHKIYGPKGIGALYVRRKPRVRIEAQIHGGGHERGFRSGTLATHQIVGFGEAARLAKAEMASENERVRSLRDRLLKGIQDIEEAYVNGDLDQRIPHNLNVSFNFVEGESLIMAVKDLAVSSGSACTSASLEPSYVLRALGRSDELAHSSIRFTLGRFTTEDEIDFAIDLIKRKVAKLRELSPLWEMHKEGIDLSTVQWAAH
jgi:cysteine desulfurase